MGVMVGRENRAKRRIVAAAISVVAAIAFWTMSRTPGDVDEAFAARRNGVVLTAEGTVQRVLPDDTEGSPHQRFILETVHGGTVLIAHNIALAPRVPGLREGTPVTVHGQYEWNDRGGVIHWTHHDPEGRHEGGWIEHGGKRYE
jgi:hypothetical protein